MANDRGAVLKLCFSGKKSEKWVPAKKRRLQLLGRGVWEDRAEGRVAASVRGKEQRARRDSGEEGQPAAGPGRPGADGTTQASREHVGGW